jgi:hypothetical protein
MARHSRGLLSLFMHYVLQHVKVYLPECYASMHRRFDGVDCIRFKEFVILL